MPSGPPPTEPRYDFPLPPALDHRYAKDVTVDVIAELSRLESQAGGRLKVVRTMGELRECVEGDVIAAVLHFEGAEAIDGSLDDLSVFYEAGLRSVGIVWSRPNAFASGVPFRFRLPDGPA
jgi:membrane dipeptidase